MKLNEYLNEFNVSRKAFSKKAGISYSFLSDLSTGYRKPSIATALKIEAASQGLVAVPDLIEIEGYWLIKKVVSYD